MGQGADGNLARAAPLRPGGLEDQAIAMIGLERFDFQGFFAPEAKGALQLEAHPHVRIADADELVEGQIARLGHLRDGLSLRHAIGGVAAREQA